MAGYTSAMKVPHLKGDRMRDELAETDIIFLVKRNKSPHPPEEKQHSRWDQAG
jgi:hypothetical protein